MADQRSNEQNAGVEAGDHEPREIVVPLFAEEISVSKRVVPKARVRVSRITREREEVVEQLLAREHVEVERMVIGRTVESMPTVREEGDTIIVPIVEEVLIVERRLVLKEELHIRKIRETERHQERVMLRRQEATVLRLPVEDSAA
jgi:stress response protein YsnF